MKRASNILLKIAHIFGLVMGILLLLCFIPAIIIAFLPEARDAMVQVFQNNGIDFGDDPEVLAMVGQIIIITYSLVFVILGSLSIIDAVVSKKAMENPTKGRLIACMILGLMSTDFSFVGGLLGIFALSKENHQKKLEE